MDAIWSLQLIQLPNNMQQKTKSLSDNIRNFATRNPKTFINEKDLTIRCLAGIDDDQHSPERRLPETTGGHA